MKKFDKIKFIMLISFTVFAFIAGCVDTGVQNVPQKIDLRSDVNIVNLAVGTGTATVNLYGSIADPAALSNDSLASKYDMSSPELNASLAFGNATGYKDIGAGAKQIIVSYSGKTAIDTFTVVSPANYKLRYFIFTDATAPKGQAFVRSTERYLWQKPGSTEGASLFPSDTGFVRVINASPDADDIAEVVIMSSDTTTVSVSLANQGIGSYIKLKSGVNYTIALNSSTTTLVSFTLNPKSRGRYSAVMYDNAASLKSKVFTDD